MDIYESSEFKLLVIIRICLYNATIREQLDIYTKRKHSLEKLQNAK